MFKIMRLKELCIHIKKALIGKRALNRIITVCTRDYQGTYLDNLLGMNEYNEQMLRYKQQNRLYLFKGNYEILGSRDGAMVRVLASHQSDPGSILRPSVIHKWMEFPVSSRIAPRVCTEGLHRGFTPGSPVFLRPQKPTSRNSNSTRIEDPCENQLRLMWLLL